MHEMMTLLALLALAQVSGYVYAPDGSVVAGKTVRAGEKTSVTDKEGAFTITGLPEGVVELNVESTTVFALTGDSVSITTTSSATPDDDPAPPTGEGVVTGRVLLDGKPLANAPVLIEGLGEETPVKVRVVSNAKGEFIAKGLPPMQYWVSPDERLSTRLWWLHARRRYPAGQNPTIVDLGNTSTGSNTVELKPAPMIHGRVVDANGNGVARASVKLVMATRSTLDFLDDASTARTMADGSFAFPAPQSFESENVMVSVTPPLQSTFRSKPFILGSENREINVALPKLETVRVRVLDRAGKPIPNARLGFGSSSDTSALSALTLLVEEPFAGRTGRTNAEGEVVLQLAADAYDFVGAADGFLIGTLPSKAIARPMAVDLTLQRAVTLRGRVHRGDRGVADARVSIVDENPSARDVFARTGADGKFEITGLAPGLVSIHVLKQEELLNRTFDVKAPDDIDVALPPAGTLVGRVIAGDTRKPVEDFDYSVTALDELNWGLSTGATSADGTFRMEIPAGMYRVNVSAPGYTSLDLEDVRVVENETTNVDLPLGRGVVVNGRVIDEDGQPVPGATVFVIDADDGFMPGRAKPPDAETDGNGAFTITGIETGSAYLSVQHPGFMSYHETIKAEDQMSLEIHLTRGLSIRGVVMQDGKPLPGVKVIATSTAIGSDAEPATTGDDGRFTLPGLREARYTVAAYTDERHAEVRDVDPRLSKEVVLSLDPKPRGIVYGTVTGIPPSLGGKYISRIVRVDSGSESAESWIDDSGNYRIEKAPAGEATIRVWVESFNVEHSSPPKSIEVVAGRSLRVDLDLGGNLRVSGRVTIDGKPVADMHIGFDSENGVSASAKTRDDGMYEVMLAGAGRYYIHAQAERFQRNFQVSREIREGETVDIDLREQRIEGTVIDAVTRRPIEDALVSLVPGAVMVIATNASTDSDGHFEMVKTVAGAYRLIASREGYAPRVQPFGGTMTQYVFELMPAPDLLVRVLDSHTGAPLYASVDISGESGYIPMKSRLSDDGSTFLFSLAPGKYRVTATVSGDEKRVKVVEVTAPGTVDVMME